MMRFFVRNLFAKLFLLGLLAVPLALYGLNESKKLAQAGIADDRAAPPAPGGETELKRTQDESAKLASMPSDLRKELLFPGGWPTNDSGEPYIELNKAVRNRAGILAAHRQFVLRYNAIVTGKEPDPKFDQPIPVGLGADLAGHYLERWKERRDQVAARVRLKDLRAKLKEADTKMKLDDVAKEIDSEIAEYTKRWPEAGTDIAKLRDELLKRLLESISGDLKDACQKLDDSWKLAIQLRSSATLKPVQTQIEAVLPRLSALVAKLARDDTVLSKWADDTKTMWTKRSEFIREALILLESVDKALADGRVRDFFDSCAMLLKSGPDETKSMVRGIAEDFCTRYLVQPPKEPLKYDDVVLVTGNDEKTVQDFPRKQVKIYYKKKKDKDGENKEDRRFLKDGDPFKNDGYTEFHAALDKDKVEHITVFDAKGEDPINSKFIQRPITSLKPTPKSAAVRFYCDEYQKVDRWNAETVSAFVGKCEPHKEYLGEVWNRLEKMNKAMKDARDLFAAKTN